MKILILSDVHGNLNALNAVLESAKQYNPSAVAFLGDLVDYGMRSNEVIAKIKKLDYPVVCNLRGNHEDSIISEKYERFSAERGRVCAKHTGKLLSAESRSYISSVMSEIGKQEFNLCGKKFMAIHGSLVDEFWTSIFPTSDLKGYEKYDYVLSGHSHLPHYFEKYYTVENVVTRNKKKTIFINPGSVGQPRNLNNLAQYAVLDVETEEIVLKKVSYDIENEQSYFSDEVDEFYKNRLKDGV
jgi:putative phosphoesterase